MKFLLILAILCTVSLNGFGQEAKYESFVRFDSVKNQVHVKFINLNKFKTATLSLKYAPETVIFDQFEWDTKNTVLEISREFDNGQYELLVHVKAIKKKIKRHRTIVEVILQVSGPEKISQIQIKRAYDDK